MQASSSFQANTPPACYMPQAFALTHTAAVQSHLPDLSGISRIQPPDWCSACGEVLAALATMHDTCTAAWINSLQHGTSCVHAVAHISSERSISVHPLSCLVAVLIMHTQLTLALSAGPRAARIPHDHVTKCASIMLSRRVLPLATSCASCLLH